MPPFVSASAVIVEGDRILMVVDPIRGEPVLPGGHLRWRERPEEAAVREVHEETGYRIRTGTLIAVLAGPEWAGEEGVVRIIYGGEVVGGQSRSSGEGEVCWLPIHEVINASSRDAGILGLWRERQASQPCSS